MVKKYTKNQLWNLYEKLPKELQLMIFSEKTANNVWNICKRNNIKQVSKVANCIGNVLLGISPLDEFEETLEKELKLTRNKTKKIVQEINHFVFSPAEESLAKLDEKGVQPIKKKEVKPKRPLKKDVYREPIE